MGTRLNRLSEAVLTCTHDLCFKQKEEISLIFHLKIFIFTAVKNHCILHRHVCVMGKPFYVLTVSKRTENAQPYQLPFAYAISTIYRC